MTAGGGPPRASCRDGRPRIEKDQLSTRVVIAASLLFSRWGPASAVTLAPDTVSAVHDGLWMAVNGAGTAGRARIAGRDVAGKTGTAQVISNRGRERARGSGSAKDLRDHGWFVFMVPRDNPELAGVIFAEHSEHGYLAAPIARHIIETYYARKEGRPLPTMPLVPGTPGAQPAPPARAVATATGGAPPPVQSPGPAPRPVADPR